jgi:hypothetical protein
MNSLHKVFVFVGVLLAASTLASAGTLSGVVRNASTGTVAPGLPVVLIQLQGGMDAVATTTSDVQGRFSFNHAAIGAGPVLVRVQYQGVNYHANVPPGQPAADVEVFETTQNPAVVEVASRMIVVQPDGGTLVVGEEFSIHNHAKPPATFNTNSGTFEFFIPEGASIGQVSAWSAAGMPLTQGTMDKGKNHYAIAFPLRPNENGVRLSYQLPYPGDQATLRLRSPYAMPRVLVIAPPTMRVSGEGFAPSGTEQGWNLYARQNVAANAVFDVTISGTAPPPSEMSGAESQAAATGQVSRIPGRLDSLRWPLMGGFAALFVLGLFFLLRKPVPAVQPRAGVRVETPPAEPVGDLAAQLMSDAAERAQRAMEEIKDALFRLELRRQAGAISEADYARERQRTEQLLRELMKGAAREPSGR